MTPCEKELFGKSGKKNLPFHRNFRQTQAQGGAAISVGGEGRKIGLYFIIWNTFITGAICINCPSDLNAEAVSRNKYNSGTFPNQSGMLSLTSLAV